MIRSLYLRLKYFSYFRNKNGIKEFVSRCMNGLIEKTVNKSIAYRLKNRKLRIEKESLLAKRKEIIEQPLLDNDDYFTIKKKIRTQNFLFYTIVVSEMFLNYVSTLIFIPGEGLLFALLRWGIAIVLTGSAIIVSEKFIESIIPIIHYKKESHESQSIPKIIMWGILLIAVEIAIIGVAEARAKDIEGGTGSGVLYYGFIILSMVLPFVAGAIRWDLMHYLDAFKNTEMLKGVEKKISEIDMIIQKNEENDSLYYKLTCARYWDLLIEFKTIKENYNDKKGIEEILTGHFCESFEAFQKEADSRYLDDIRKRDPDRILKLERSDDEVGNKLGQRILFETEE